jgi:serine phosphatase RsbU (regulator of sigma subunit)
MPPRRAAGGFCEFIPTGHGSAAVAVGDVLGEGAPAGVIRSGARPALRNMAPRHAANVTAALHTADSQPVSRQVSDMPAFLPLTERDPGLQPPLKS